MADAATPPAPLPAAAVILLRDAPGGLEVLMQRRREQAKAFAGVLAFPGGKVAAIDSDPAFVAAADLGAPEPFEHARQLAALRELFEASPWAQRRPIAVEQPVVTSIGGISVRGIVDAVYTDEDPGAPADGVVIVGVVWAWRRSSSPPTEPPETSDHCYCAFHAPGIEVASPCTRCTPISMPFVSVSRVACLWQASGLTSAFSPE